MTLTDFLLARIAEDEADVLAANDVFASGPVAAEEALARVLNEDRVRADVEAKRRIVEGWADPFGTWTAMEARMAAREKARILKLLATPYADHPHYRDEWKP